jgi:CheY-like chemotaxis protein
VRDHKPLPRPAQRICDYLGARQKVLLADDDPLHLELVQNLLRPLGFTVFIARDGKTCLQLAEQCQPDLAMIDLSLPDISGWEVAQQLRAMPELERMKIMIVSANAHEYSAGAGPLHDCFVVKPIELTPLLQQVGTLLDLTWIDQPSAPRRKRARPACRAAERSLAPSSGRPVPARSHRPRARHRSQAARTGTGGPEPRGGRGAPAHPGVEF